MDYGLGVDLGTTYTAAAVRVGDRLEVVQLGSQRPEIPSVVFVKADGEMLIGDAADWRGDGEPDRLVREFKRRLGDPVPILVGGSPYSAHMLTARLLRHVIDTVTQLQQGPPRAVTVTYPANWTRFKHDFLVQAVHLADLNVVAFRTEPEAAALQYAAGQQIRPGETLAVYDLGGGTFDAAVLRRTAAGFELLGTPEGIEQLGGGDFDEAVLDHVTTTLGAATAGLDLEDEEVVAGLARLRRDCIRAKENLSFDTETTIQVALPGLHQRVRLNRSEFEARIGPPLEQTITAMRRALRSAGVEPAGLRCILLTGGASRIPLAGQLLTAAFDRPLALDAHPEHSVALGAALTTGPAIAAPPATGTPGGAPASPQPGAGPGGPALPTTVVGAAPYPPAPTTAGGAAPYTVVPTPVSGAGAYTAVPTPVSGAGAYMAPPTPVSGAGAYTPGRSQVPGAPTNPPSPTAVGGVTADTPRRATVTGVAKVGAPLPPAPPAPGRGGRVLKRAVAALSTPRGRVLTGVAALAVGALVAAALWWPQAKATTTAATPPASPAPSASAGPVQLWKAAVQEPIEAAVAADTGAVYVATGRTVRALAGADGKPVWEKTMSAEIAAAPEVAGDTVYVSVRDNQLHALAASDGEQQWQIPTGERDPGPPAVADDALYLGTSGGLVSRFRVSDQKRQWRFQTGNAIEQPPAVSADLVAVASTDGALYGFDPQDGAEPRWRQELGPSSAPVIAGERVVVGGEGDKLYAVDTQTGETEWTFDTGAAITSTPVAGGALIYVGGPDGVVHAVDAATGTERWRFAGAAADGFGTPAVTGSAVYAAAGSGLVYALDAATGRQLWSQTVDGRPGPLRITDGVLYAGTSAGTLYAWRVGPPGLPGPVLPSGLPSRTATPSLTPTPEPTRTRRATQKPNPRPTRTKTRTPSPTPTTAPPTTEPTTTATPPGGGG